MLAAAGRARRRLPDPAALVDFLRRQQDPGGGFRDRAGDPDLYYTVFGLEALQALDAAGPDVTAGVAAYLKAAGEQDCADLVALSCLARCRADLATDQPPATDLLDRLEAFRCPAGGYSQSPGAQTPNLFGCFLALGVFEDLQAQTIPQQELLDSLNQLRCPDGGYTADPAWPVAAVPATAAAGCMLTSFGRTLAGADLDWLWQQRQDGAFAAVAGAPMADLLSTAVALHALDSAGVDLDAIAADCRRFVASMRCGSGGYRGTAFDNEPDCEYTFYALLALGHLEGTERA
jgi:prenyltransferase beta subunit